jgi:hypothetical protein
VTANGIVISWTGVGVLDRATNAVGPYAPVPWPLSPYTNATLQAAEYFRLRQ